MLVHHVVDVFEKGTMDEEWVPAAAKHKDGVITEDYKMRRVRQLEPICRDEKVVMIFFRPPSHGLESTLDLCHDDVDDLGSVPNRLSGIFARYLWRIDWISRIYRVARESREIGAYVHELPLVRN